VKQQERRADGVAVVQGTRERFNSALMIVQSCLPAGTGRLR
jgi:hypothetical protein